MPVVSEADVLNSLGGAPESVARELQDFTRSAQILSSEHPRLIDQFPKEWVAVFDGKVAAHSSELKNVLNQLEAAHIEPSKAIIRFIDKDGPPLIL